jgi:hypothetical protein
VPGLSTALIPPGVVPYSVSDLAGCAQTSRMRATVMTLCEVQAELEQVRCELEELKACLPEARSRRPSAKAQIELDFAAQAASAEGP